MSIEEICVDVVGSEAGEAYYKCLASLDGYAHWAGPFFSALLLGFCAGALIAAIASS
jgi:hypothetical protein